MIDLFLSNRREYVKFFNKFKKILLLHGYDFKNISYYESSEDYRYSIFEYYLYDTMDCVYIIVFGCIKYGECAYNTFLSIFKKEYLNLVSKNIIQIASNNIHNFMDLLKTEYEKILENKDNYVDFFKMSHQYAEKCT